MHVSSRFVLLGAGSVREGTGSVKEREDVQGSATWATGYGGFRRDVLATQASAQEAARETTGAVWL